MSGGDNVRTKESAEVLLVREIGQAAIDAIRSLDAGQDAHVVLCRYRESVLPPTLKSVMGIARKSGVVTHDEIRQEYQYSSPQSVSNMLKELAKRQLLLRLDVVHNIESGGRSFVYRVWDNEQEVDLSKYRVRPKLLCGRQEQHPIFATIDNPT